jgi:hypothetical protein
VHREAIGSPAIIVVGDVLRATQALDSQVRRALAA